VNAAPRIVDVWIASKAECRAWQAPRFCGKSRLIAPSMVDSPILGFL
jgi:hypothetical protein